MAVWNTIKNFFVGNAMRIVMFFCILIIGAILIKLLLVGIKKLIKRSKLEPTVGGFIFSALKFCIIMLYILVLCSTVGIPITSIVAIITALSLAVGLAVQNSVSNIANGLVLLNTKPYKIGDYVSIGGTEGTVLSVKMINTVLLTPTNEQITIPHNTTAGAVIKNFSMEEFRRVDLMVSVDYGSDVEQVKSVLLAVANAHDNVIKDKDITVRLHTRGASSLDFVVRVWVASGDYWNTYFDLNEQIVDAFNKNAINIPFTTIDVNLKK